MQVMGIPESDQRRAPRHSVHTSGTILCNGSSHVAWVKDISQTGALLYTKHCPAVGESVRVTLDTRKDSRFRDTYEGKVIRVQNSGAGGAIGVAVLFTLLGAVMAGAA
jgi:hypothetical protein